MNRLSYMLTYNYRTVAIGGIWFSIAAVAVGSMILLYNQLQLQAASGVKSANDALAAAQAVSEPLPTAPATPTPLPTPTIAPTVAVAPTAPAHYVPISDSAQCIIIFDAAGAVLTGAALSGLANLQHYRLFKIDADNCQLWPQ